MHRRSWRLVPSHTVWESPAGAKMVFGPSQTVFESHAGAQLVWAPSETVENCVGLSYRCPDDLGTVAVCLGVSWHGFWVPT
ncbi:hypothetical protein DPMN_024313 [Dreissena polymorpha]|uniref:Uncharacterized protein n=1 Tax=Dreissena polymorpha TaxID=45954 RepID=A0A9D4LNP0_DREPO|nr:hypothetical protein DPMN_024313 [Dreissena polymorpha]